MSSRPPRVFCSLLMSRGSRLGQSSGEGVVGAVTNDWFGACRRTGSTCRCARPRIDFFSDVEFAGAFLPR
jgi:hypothetical protein